MDIWDFIQKHIKTKVDYDGYAGPQCFTKGHCVLMSDWTYKPIEDIKVGDKVIGYDNQVNTVVKLFNTKRKVVHLRTELGDFYVTPDHPFYCQSGRFVPAQHLEKETPALFDREIYAPSGLTDNELKFLGFWLGDGNIGYHKDNRTDEIRITYGVKKRAFVHSLGLTGDERVHQESENAYVAGLLKREHKKLTDFILNVCGAEKKLPLTFSNREYSLILEGFINADGSPHHNSYRITNTNLPLLMAFQAMCIKLGCATKSLRLSKRSSDYIRIKGKLVKSIKPLYMLTVCFNNTKTHKRYLEYLEESEQEVYNLETDGTHTYICNNYKVHNCMDLYRQWCDEGWNIPRTESLGADGGAKDLVLRYNEFPIEKKYLNLITDRFCGQQEDVVVFGATEKNKYGHVAIVIETFPTYLVVFEQDGFKQDGAKIAKWDYKTVIGYLRPWSEV
ncbi:MAG: hypothetical protein J6V90_07990 [Treponema sp.]|nr:hypothetical protein [Treponema sp.]